MRKYYATQLTKLLAQEIKWLILLGIGIVLGCLYAISVSKNYPLFYAINQFVATSPGTIVTMKVFRDSCITYGVQLGSVVLCSYFKWLQPLAIIIIGLIGFTYGFTVSVVIILYGIKGVLISFTMLGIQSVILFFALIYIGEKNIGSVKIGKTGDYKHKLTMIMQMSIVIGVLAFVNAFIQPILESMTRINQ